MMNCSTEIEQKVLGSIIIEPAYIPDVLATIRNKGIFSDEFHATVYDEIDKMYTAADKVDLCTLALRPALRGKAGEIAALTQSVGSGADSLSYARILCEQHMRRRLEAVGSELMVKASRTEDVGDVISWAQRSIDDTLDVVTLQHSSRALDEILCDTMHNIEKRAIAFNRGEPVGIMTGLKSLDETLGGLRGGQLVILAGRPAMGKSAVMLHFARKAAEMGTPTVIFSLEMGCQELSERLIQSGLQMDGGKYKRGEISNDEWHDMELTRAELGKLPIEICDSSNLTIQTIKARCQQLKNKGRCGMVIIDYLQLLDLQKGNRNSNRERDVAETSRQAKIMAAELDVPVILLSQLSRKVEERADKTPLLSDLRDSGAIEQDADIVMFITRPAVYKVESIQSKRYGYMSTKGLGILTIAKHRNGRIGNCYFRHSDDLNLISDYY